MFVHSMKKSTDKAIGGGGKDDQETIFSILLRSLKRFKFNLLEFRNYFLNDNLKRDDPNRLLELDLSIKLTTSEK